MHFRLRERKDRLGIDHASLKIHERDAVDLGEDFALFNAHAQRHIHSRDDAGLKGCHSEFLGRRDHYPSRRFGQGNRANDFRQGGL